MATLSLASARLLWDPSWWFFCFCFGGGGGGIFVPEPVAGRSSLMSRLWSSGPRRQSQFTPDKERHETRARGDDGGRETETGHSGPISYSGGPPLIKCRSTREKKPGEAKGKYAIRNCGEERKKGKKKLLFTETDVGRVQTAPHTESQESLIFFHPVRFPTAPGRRGGKTLRDGFFGQMQIWMAR